MTLTSFPANLRSILRMPILPNAKKALRQSQVRAERNLKVKENISYLRRNFRKLLEAKKFDEAKAVVRDLTKLLDKAVSKGVVKKNTAARIKSRTAVRLNKESK